MNNTSIHKEAAIAFLTLVTENKIQEAYQTYIAPGFFHHNAYFHSDATALMIGMEESAARFPSKVLEIQRVLQDGDFVVVHSRMTLKPNFSMVLVHIFRFENNLIVELWDVGQPVPEDITNERGMF